MESDESPPTSNQWLDSLGKTSLVALPAAYISGYLAWAVGVKMTGLTFIQGSALGLAALGGISLILSLGVLIPLWVGLNVTFQMHSKDRKGAVLLGLVLGGILGASLLAALVGFLITTLSKEPPGTTQFLIGLTGLVLVPLLQGYILWLSRSDDDSEAIIKENPTDFVDRKLVPWAVVFSIFSAGALAGVAVVPDVPATLGGLAPERAIVELDLDSAVMFEYLINHTGSIHHDGVAQVPVWLFPDDSGNFVVRHACDSRSAGAAYTIPAEAVQGIQWITETTRENRCDN